MVEILGKDLDNWDNSIAAREPFHLSETGKTGAKFMTGADLLRSAKITSVWKDPVAIYAQAYSPYAKASQPVLSLGRSAVDTLANFLPGLASVGAQTYLETVSLLSDREYPLTKYAKRIVANTTEDVENRRMVRELYNQSGNIDSEKWYNEAGSIIGAMLPTMAAGNLAWSTTRTLGASRAAATRIASDVVKGFVGAEMAGQYAEETAAQYLQRTGDKNFENFTARDATGLTAAAYGAIGAQIEFIGGVEPIMAGALSKVGLKTGLLKAGAKIGVGEATEELLQGLTETLLRKIDGSSEKTWKEGFEESLKGAAWGLFIGGTMGSTAFHVNRRNLVKGIKTTFPNVTNEEATQIADAMIDNVGEISSQDPTLRNVLRQKVALIYESADIENKEGTIDAITDLEYSLIAADSAERGIDIAENPLFKGEVNALGWFREGIPEARRSEIEGYVKELVDLKDQLKTLNEAKEKDWAKIDEIENKLDKFNSYVLEKLSDIARADGRQVAKILDDMEGTFVQKEKERRFVPPTPEERIEIDNKTTAIQEDLQKDGFKVNKKQYVNYTSGDGATYLYVSGKGQTPLVIRIGVSPIGRYHKRVNANFNANMSTEEILTVLRNMIDRGNIPNNRKGQNVNIGFATRPSAEPIMQNRVSGGAPATYRGAYIPEYRFILRANRMDASTLSHELAHDWFETNFARYRSGEATPDFMRAWGALEKALGVEEGAKVAPRKASEIFARAYEGWVMNKSDWEKAINVDDKDKDDIVKLMQDYQNNLRDIYEDLTNPYFKQTWGKLGELKPELVKWFDRMTNIRDLDRLVERGEMSEAEASQEKLNRAIDTVIEATEDPESKQRLEYARTLNDTKRYEVEGGNKNSIQRRLGALAQAIDENNILIKENYDTRRDMLEVAKQADNFVRTRLDDALAIINGQMAEQEGLFKEDIYTALERLALEEGDLGLLDELKNSEIANRLAKELGQRVAGFRNWSGGEMDVVSSLKALDNRFNKALQNKKAQAQLQEAEQMFAKAQAEQDKLADKQLEATLKDLECK